MGVNEVIEGEGAAGDDAAGEEATSNSATQEEVIAAVRDKDISATRATIIASNNELSALI